MLGVLMTVWSLTILPIVIKFSSALGNDFLPAGYFLIRSIGISLRFDWKIIKTEDGLDFVLRYSDHKQRKERSMRDMRRMKPELTTLFRETPILRKNLLSYFSSLSIRADISIGLQDAAATALLCGAISVFSGCLPRMRSRVQPVFNHDGFCFNAKCIASFRLGKLLLSAALYLHASMMQHKRQKAGGAAHGKSASN